MLITLRSAPVQKPALSGDRGHRAVLLAPVARAAHEEELPASPAPPRPQRFRLSLGQRLPIRGALDLRPRTWEALPALLEFRPVPGRRPSSPGRSTDRGSSLRHPPPPYPTPDGAPSARMMLTTHSSTRVRFTQIPVTEDRRRRFAPTSRRTTKTRDPLCGSRPPTRFSKASGGFAFALPGQDTSSSATKIVRLP